MLSISKKFIFIHIPKTGGNSIQDYLIGFTEEEKTYNFKDRYDENTFGIVSDIVDTHKHSPLYEYKQLLSMDIFSELFTFSVIRNPWERAISYYFSPSRGGGIKWDKEEFIKFLWHIKPVGYYLSSKPKIIIKLKDHLKINSLKLGFSVNHIIRFEELQKGLKEVCDLIDVPYKKIKHLNQSKRKHYSEYYDDELIEIIRKKYWEEIEWGNYIFSHSH